MFGTDYTANKAQLAKIATVHSKMIRNKLVGKITKAMIAASAETEDGQAAAAQEMPQQGEEAAAEGEAA